MKATKYFLHYLMIAAVALFIAACSGANSKDKSGDKKAMLDSLKGQQAELAKEIKKLEEEIAKENPGDRKVKAKEVAIKEVTPQNFDHFVQTQGKVEAEDNILVSARSMGSITTVHVTEGQAVSKGQVLVQLDNSVILRSIESMKSQLELANTVYQRQKNLWDQKIGTEVQYLQAKTGKESLEKQIESLQEQNDMSRIKSPINGTVDEIFVKIGESTAPGMPAVRVVNTSDLKLVADVSEAYATQIKKGSKVVVTIPELKKEIISTVTFVGKTINPLSRTFSMEVKLADDQNLRPNMTGVVKVIFYTEKSALVVPINVIQTVNEDKILYVVETKGQQTIATHKVVTIDGVYNGQAQVKGLSAGDKVITVGYQGLSDGDVVKL